MNISKGAYTEGGPSPDDDDYLLLALIIEGVHRQGHRPEMPREFVVLVDEIERLRTALKLIDSGADAPQEIARVALE